MIVFWFHRLFPTDPAYPVHLVYVKNSKCNAFEAFANSENSSKSSQDSPEIVKNSSELTMCLKVCHSAEYQMDYSNGLLNSLSRSTQNLIQSSSQLTHEAYDTFRHHSSLHSPLHSSSSSSTTYRTAAFSNFQPANSMNSTSDPANSLTQSICQSLAQSSGLVVRLAKLVLDLYCSTMDLSFLVQLFTFGLDQTGVDLQVNFNQQPNNEAKRAAEDKKEENNQCDENNPHRKRMPFTASVDNHLVHNLPDIITSHQRDQNLKQKQHLIDVGRKLRFIAEQFEKQRSIK